MDIPKILQEFAGKDIVVIKAKTMELSSDMVSLDGTFEEFKNVIFQTKCSQILFTEAGLEEEDFEIESEYDDLTQEPLTADSLSSQLKKYRKYVGQKYDVVFYAWLDKFILTYSIKEDWYLQFLSLYEDTVVEFKQSKASDRMARREEEEGQKKNVLDQIQNLYKNAEFVSSVHKKGSTVRALLVLANKFIPDIGILGAGPSKEAVQKVIDRIRIDAV